MPNGFGSGTRRLQAVGFVVFLLLLGSVAALLLDAVGRYTDDAEDVAHTQHVLATLAGLEARVQGAIAQQRLFLLLGDPDSLAKFSIAAGASREIALELPNLFAADSPQAGLAGTLERQVDARMTAAEGVAVARQQGGLQAAVTELGKGQGLVLERDIERRLAQLRQTEQQRLLDRQQVSEASNSRLALLGSLGLLLAALVVVSMMLLLLRENRQRRRAEQASESDRAALRRSVGELETRQQQLRSLADHSSLLQDCQNELEALEVSANALRELCAGWSGALYLMRASRDYAERARSWGPAASQPGEVVAMQACWALRRAESHLLPSPEAGPRCAHLPAPDECCATSLCVPLLAQGELQGLLWLGHEGMETGEPIRDLAESAGRDLALTLGNLRLRESLRRQSIRDPLTGLFNRRYLDESLGRELARCRRRQQPLTVLMCDLDHFKRLNDGFGHEAGDAVLRAFGELLGKAGRGEDIPCRYGGEEFLLILPDADATTALGRAERIRGAVAALRVEHLGRPVGALSVSIGVACAPQHGEDEASLLRAADAALYAAKHGGRNRVVLANSGAETGPVTQAL
ncbi:diguanylate cyclase [Pseudomarimonas salicorniae]|uniref:diguanylate cyclase n=1 Tax=Pseudomarimonas salicorniae TaxID=2933270 RepID=A0ABT0GHN2_9GAMM|nr:diguanylate cyclase [Lysobacter sp. CAU 1642]MCK7593547.1 diguanylate cyclase [Lysobacter sp. CAU 1642]